MAIAEEPIYENDANGVARLVAAPGDTIPPVGTALQYGVVSQPDPPEASILPFDGFDELGEDEVLVAMDAMDGAARQHVRAYERAHQARGMILRYQIDMRPVPALDQTPSPAITAQSEHGYTKMRDADLDAEVARRGLAIKGTSREAKIKALQAQDAKNNA